MKRLPCRYPTRSSSSRTLFPRRWLPACFFLVILAALLPFGLVTGVLGADTGSATITIDATAAQIQGYINPLVFGHNVCFFDNNLWDHTTDGLITDKVDNPEGGNTVKSRIEQLAPTILRFPGGTASDYCLW